MLQKSPTRNINNKMILIKIIFDHDSPRCSPKFVSLVIARHRQVTTYKLRVECHCQKLNLTGKKFQIQMSKSGNGNLLQMNFIQIGFLSWKIAIAVSFFSRSSIDHPKDVLTWLSSVDIRFLNYINNLHLKNSTMYSKF